MKTIEEKAKAYDESLERAKEQLNGAKVFDYDNEQIAHDIRTTVYNIFPELKESEDKRIRKALIMAINNICNGDDGLVTFNGFSKEQVLAWLEKQENKDSQVILPNILWHDGSEEPEEQCEILCEWESKDAVWHDVAFYHADTKTFWNGEEKIEDVVRWIYVNEMIEQNPAWSEEDEKHLLGCVNYFSGITESSPYYNDFLWLKFLKDRVGCAIRFTTTKAWNEEDEAHFDSILKRLEGMCKPNATYTATRCSISADKDWLKSLKEKFVKFDKGFNVGFSAAKYNQWEPSDWQMASITCAVRKMKESACYDSELVSLLNDLKKLKRE